MEVAPCYKLLTLLTWFTMFTWFTLFTWFMLWTWMCMWRFAKTVLVPMALLKGSRFSVRMAYVMRTENQSSGRARGCDHCANFLCSWPYPRTQKIKGNRRAHGYVHEQAHYWQRCIRVGQNLVDTAWLWESILRYKLDKRAARFPKFLILPKNNAKTQHFWQNIENWRCFIHLFWTNCQFMYSDIGNSNVKWFWKPFLWGFAFSSLPKFSLF